jgi:putative intracellular protease/amidase
MRTLYLFVTDTLSDWEPGNVLAELQSGRYLKDPALRYPVVLCGRTMEPVTTMGGIHMVPEVLIGDIRPAPDDVLILPGADTWLDPSQEPVIAKVRELLDHGTVIAAICGATLGLANAGLLDQRPHTSNDPAVLKMFCPNYRGEHYYVNEPAVTDDNLITASGLAPVEFAYHVFRKLDVMNPAALEAWHGLFTTRRPEFFYTLMESLRTDR